VSHSPDRSRRLPSKTRPEPRGERARRGDRRQFSIAMITVRSRGLRIEREACLAFGHLPKGRHRIPVARTTEQRRRTGGPQFTHRGVYRAPPTAFGSVAARSRLSAPRAGVMPNRITAARKNRWLPPPVSRTLRACRSVLVNPGWTTMLLAATSAARKRRSSSSAKCTFASLDWPYARWVVAAFEVWVLRVDRATVVTTGAGHRYDAGVGASEQGRLEQRGERVVAEMVDGQLHLEPVLGPPRTSPARCYVERR